MLTGSPSHWLGNGNHASALLLADKGRVRQGLTFWADSNPRAILATALRMAAAGHAPSDLLLLRLTDGRVRVFPGAAASERLNRIGHENGPAAAAFRVSCERSKSGVTAEVQDWTRGSAETWRQAAVVDSAGRWKQLPPTREPAQLESESRKAAIFAASLGMTTGALPKAASIESPPGVFKPPVW